MNAGSGSTNMRPLIGAAAAIALIVCFFLPWLTWSGLASYSLVDIVSKSSGGGWLTLLLLIGGAILAAAGSGAKALGASISRTPTVAWAAGFGSALGGLALYLISLSGHTSATYYGYSYSTGLAAGIGVWLGIAAAVVGLVAGLVELTGAGQAFPVVAAGPWPATQASAQPGYGWQNTAPPPAVQSPAAYGATASAGRLAFVEGGRPTAVSVNPGEQVVLGRDPSARVRLSDPKVSRQHAMIQWTGSEWVVRDLGASNPTRVIGPSGVAQPLAGEARIASGQLLVGDVLVTLFPTGA